MELVYFALGMAVIIQVLTIMLVYTLKTKIGQIEKEIEFLERGSQNVANDLHRRIEDEVRDLKFQNNETILGIERELHELKYIVDSRFDNFSSKSKKEKNLLKG